MSKKQPARASRPPSGDRGEAISPEKGLDLRRQRQLSDELRRLRPGDALPDWRALSLAERFSAVLRTLSVPARDALGKSDTQLRRYRSGAEIPFTVVATMAAEAELPIEWLATGEPTHAAGGAPDDVPVQKLVFTASAEPGSVAPDDHAGTLSIPRTVLDRAYVKPENARIYEMRGEGMKPTISDGDLLLVDLADNAIAEGKIYVLSVGEDVFVKRLRNTGARIMKRADNQELYPGEEVIPGGVPVRVYGRVKWAGRNL